MKRLLSKISLAIFFPLIILAGTEGLLRLFKVGYPTSFLRSESVDGQSYWVNNPFYGYRFFAPRIARNPAPIRMTNPKQPGITRIVVLGESAAMGDPAIEFSLARGLDKMLNPPGSVKQFEVINAAMTAINSPVIVDIAGELAQREVDVFVIYMGNNEVVGPFGPGTAITSGDWGQALTPWRVKATRLRMAGMMRGAVQASSQQDDEPAAWAGMEMFEQNRIPADDPRLTSMYNRYEDNVRRILEIAQRHDIRVVLCTMAVNLSDSAPFGSSNRTDLASTELREWNKHYREARKAHQDGALDTARAAYQQTSEIDDVHSELMYRMGKVSESLGDHEVAAGQFARARDLDIQRFRTDSRINQIIRESASNHTDVVLADVETAFGQLDDRDLFVDHVHFSMTGLDVVCQVVFGKLSTWYELSEPPSQDELMSRLMRTPWSERKEAVFMMERRTRPPFTSQWGNQEQIERLVRQVEAANAQIATTKIEHIDAAFRSRFTEDPNDLQIAAQWGQILCVEKKWAQAAPVMQEAVEHISGYTDIHSLAALAHAMNGQTTEAAAVLLRTGPPYGYYLSDACMLIVNALVMENRKEDARLFARAMLGTGARFPGRNQLAKIAKPAHP